MNIELTQQQQQILDTQTGTPPRVVDPRSNAAYYLIGATDYDAVRELLEEQRCQKSIRGVGLRNAARRIGEFP